MLTISGQNRLQHRWCLHLFLLGASPGRLHGPTCSTTSQTDRLQHWWCVHLQYFIWVLLQVGFMVLHVHHLTEGTGSSTGGVFTSFFWALLQVGFVVLHVLHLTEGTGSSTGSTGSFSRQDPWSYMFSTSWWGQASAPMVSSPTSSGCFSR
jgi:hypothetical protein